MSNLAIRARVTGRVQGVWFRCWTRDEAAQLGLDGWVRNEPDGSVSALLSGPQEAVMAMIGLLHHGPDMARVVAVETEETTEAVPEGFAILR